jgi:coenzyme F420-reducing hydrogenase delta subunit
MSGSQAHGFVNAAKQMTQRIRELGPSPLRRPEPAEQVPEIE